ncbi:glycoside hydrolase family 2 protein [Paenibacillus cymbidii]|uniref:glycoside hydrolase family 2 protein n=1 Tax=Paenibacillus cymbidii TaxID=1639034 RepID=UPI0010813D79|nr:glycoside hydrolase family 2 TIM barrel-domain containing protein [Paenibacillus cymbidii]
MERSRTYVNNWLFQVDHNRIGERREWFAPGHDKSGWMPVASPMAWDCYQEAFRGFEGIGWYAATLAADGLRPGALHRLLFGSVSGQARVWVNGRFAGEHIGSYLPFEFELNPYVPEGAAAEIVVRVDNRPREDWLPGTPIVEWVQYGGLLQEVVVETTDFVYIAGVGVRSAPERGGERAAVFCEAEIVNRRSAPFVGRVRIDIPDGERASSAFSEVSCPPGGSATVPIGLELAEPRLWRLDDPHLYGLQAQLLQPEAPHAAVDAVKERFGIRTIEVSGRELLLNGEPLLIKGVNRYDEYGDFGPTPPESAIREELLRIKRTGANLIRAHYPQSPTHLNLMDEIGLLHMAELPLNWWMSEWYEREYYPQVVDMAEEALACMVRRDRNHPCVVIWSMCNECGTNKEVGIQAMRRLMRRARELDGTRLVGFVTTSSLGHLANDEADVVFPNLYYGVFSQSQQAMEIAEFGQLVYTPTLEALRKRRSMYPDKPIVLGEFGNHGILGLKGNDRFSETYQARYLETVWQAALDAGIQGGIIWAWADYRHRRDFYNTDGQSWNAPFGPFGLVTVDRRPKLSLDAATRMFHASPQPNKG